MALKIIEIELFSNIDKKFRIIEAIVDTGASEKNAQDQNIPILWHIELF